MGRTRRMRRQRRRKRRRREEGKCMLSHSYIDGPGWFLVVSP
jgi:hypothetical protein